MRNMGEFSLVEEVGLLGFSVMNPFIDGFGECMLGW